MLEIGDIKAVDATIETYSRLARELRQPLHLWLEPLARSTRALMAGRFEEVELFARQALAMGERAQDQNAVLFFNTQMAALRKLQGRYEDLVAPSEEMVEKYPTVHGWRANLAQVYSKLGRRNEARMHYKPFAASSFAEVKRDGAWVSTMAGFSEVASFLGDVPGATALYQLLIPFQKRHFVAGNAGVFYGPISNYLGRLASTIKWWDESAAHFEHAMEACRQAESPPFEAYARYEYGAMLLAKNNRAERERALHLLDEAIGIASELGMRKVADDARGLKSLGGRS